MVIAITILASYCLVFTEGLFFLTKPSFFNSWSSFESMTVLFIAPLALNVLSLIVLVPGLIAVLLLPESLRMLPAIYTVLPAIILTFLILLLVENFTYTVWGFNIGSFKGIFRYVYTIAILACVIWLSRDLWRLVALLDQSPLGQKLKLSAAVLLLVSGLFSAINLTQKEDLFALELSKTEDDLPNILILSTDGLDASHMSAYGYHRETTPFIKSMLPQSLVVENHFTNNTKSTGSIGSLLSGKLPTKTRVIYPPDIFRGVDTYQHLPAILRKLGYRNADFSMRHYIDPYDLNMRVGFDFANGRDIGEVPQSVTLPDVTRHAFIKESYFLEIVLSRILNRLQHALSIKNMINPYREVMNLDVTRRFYPDEERIEQLFNFIDSASGPFFAHVHLLVTHGEKFNPKQQVFSLGQQQNTNWMTDFYDDAILNYDQIVEQAIDQLKKKGLYEKTLIIITSDHGSVWRATERIPLVLRFPESQYAGVRLNNTQRVDVTASILDYLGVEKPVWIDGESFLDGELKADRNIFYADASELGGFDKAGWRSVANYAAPYYSLGGVGAIVAQQWYFLDVADGHLSSGVIGNHTAPLDEADLPSAKQFYLKIVEHLEQNNYPMPQF